MIIGIDIRTLMDKQYSGVSEYTYNLIWEILRQDKTNHYKLFYNSFHDITARLPDFNAPNAELIGLRYPNKILNYFCWKLLGRPKIDKLLGVNLFFMPHLNFIALNSGCGSLLTIHDLSFLQYPEYFSLRKNIWHIMLRVKKLLKKFDQIIAVSANTKNDIVEWCGIDAAKIKVVYSGVGEEYRKINFQFSPLDAGQAIFNFQSNPNDQIFKLNADEIRLVEVKNKYKLPGQFILYLGTIEPRKNVDGIIRAYNELRVASSELRDYKLVIAGAKGWKSEKIYQEWEQSKFKDDIKFIGYINSTDKVFLYNLAEIFVYPSFYEGFGLPPLEAMACGLPVVTSFISSLPEVVGDAALLVDPHNEYDIAQAMAQVLADDSLRKRMIEQGLVRANELSWAKTAKTYLEMFKTI